MGEIAQEHENRVIALEHAVQYKNRGETTDEVIKSAEKYFEFLQGKTD